MTDAVEYVAQHDWSRDNAPWSKSPDEGNWTPVGKAVDAEHAAEKFAEESDRDGDYTIISSGEGRVWVKAPDGQITRWHIRAESVPHYYGREAK